MAAEADYLKSLTFKVDDIDLGAAALAISGHGTCDLLRVGSAEHGSVDSCSTILLCCFKQFQLARVLLLCCRNGQAGRWRKC